MAEPLTSEDLKNINATLKMITDTKKAVAVAKTAGIPLGDREKELSEVELKLQAIKRAYFPGK